MQTNDGPKINKPKNKIKAFNLMPIVPSIIPYLKEVLPELTKEINILEMWDYYKIEYGEIYFYSKEYIEARELFELETEFSNLLLARYGSEKSQ